MKEIYNIIGRYKKKIVKILLVALVLTFATMLVLHLKNTYAIEIPTTLDHLPIISDLDSTHLVSGRYNENKMLETDDSSLAIKYLVEMPTNSFRIILPNEFIRAEVLEYDKDYNYIGLTDLATYDYFTKSNNTKYLLFSFYKCDEYGEKVETTSEDLYSLFDINNFTFEEIDDIDSEEIISRPVEFHAYLSYKSLINKANLRKGSTPKKAYKPVEYSPSTTSVTLRNSYKVVPEHEYYLSINDSRITAHIYWITNKNIMYDPLYDYKGMNHNTTFVVPTTKSPYVVNSLVINYTITNVDAQKKYNVIDSVLNDGARIAINYNDYYYTGTQTSNKFPNVGNIGTWRKGNFGYNRGEFYGAPGSYASQTFYSQVPKNKEYVFKADINLYKLKIIEVDSEGNNIGETSLLSDMHFKFNDNTSKFALVIVDNGTIDEDKYIDFADALNSGIKVSFSEYIPYQYDTNMEDITNQEMIQRMGLGWNLGNSFDSKMTGGVKESTKYNAIETVYRNPYVAENVIEYVKSLGFNTVRIPVTYVDNWYYDQNGNYLIREEFLDRIQEVVNYAIKRNMYVIINTHFDSGASYSPIYLGSESQGFETSKKYAKNIWTQIANRFRDYDEHLMFEGFNEVDNTINSRLCTPIAGAQMNELNQLFVDTVRNTGGNNEKRILQIQTFLSSAGITAIDAFMVPNDKYPNKLIAQVHWYPTMWDEKLEETFNRLDNFTKRTGLPVTIGETSITTSTSPTMYKYTIISNLVARAHNHNVAVIIWDNNGDRILVDRKYLTVDETYLNAIKNPQAYTGPKMTWLTEYSDFNSVKFDNTNGTYKLQYDGWGTLMSNKIPIETGNAFVRVSEVVDGDAYQRYMHEVYFYDEEDNCIRRLSLYDKYPGKQDAYLAIPENASYFRVVIYSSNYKTTLTEYKKFFDDGLIKVGYRFDNPQIDRTIIDTPIKDGETKLTKFNEFEWGMLYPDENGVVKINIGWGSITTNYIEIPEGKTEFYFNFIRRNSAVINPRYLCFYDENYNYINLGNLIKSNDVYSQTTTIPENAKYVRVGLTAFSNIISVNYNMMFATGDAALIYGFK